MKTAEDLSLIEQIDKRLKYLEALLDEALEKETPESLKQWLEGKRKNRTCNNNCSDVCGECQPTAKGELGIVEPKEVGYIYRKPIFDYGQYKQGVVYKFNEDQLQEVWNWTIPQTEAEFNQQKEVWKEGDWAWLSLSKYVIGRLTKVYGENANAIRINGAGNEIIGLNTSEFVRPTKEELENAKRSTTIVNEVEQKRWKPKYYEKYFVVDLAVENFVNWYSWCDDETDKLFYNTYNCFKTEQEAQEKANKIKELLSKK